MGRIRLIPNKQRIPSLRGHYIRYYSNGQWLVRSWPRPTGKPKSLAVQNQNNWFKGIRALLKYAPAVERINATDGDHKTGLYPDDVMMRAAAGNMYRMIDENGVEYLPNKPKVTPVAFQGFRLYRTTNQSLLAATANTMVWEAAANDTGGYWDPASPSIITIPTNVEAMVFWSSLHTNFVAATSWFHYIESVTGTPYAMDYLQTNNSYRAPISSGPIGVVPGLQFHVKMQPGVAAIANPNQMTFFSGMVVQAS